MHTFCCVESAHSQLFFNICFHIGYRYLTCMKKLNYSGNQNFAWKLSLTRHCQFAWMPLGERFPLVNYPRFQLVKGQFSQLVSAVFTLTLSECGYGMHQINCIWSWFDLVKQSCSDPIIPASLGTVCLEVRWDWCMGCYPDAPILCSRMGWEVHADRNVLSETPLCPIKP